MNVLTRFMLNLYHIGLDLRNHERKPPDTFENHQEIKSNSKELTAEPIGERNGDPDIS